MYFLNSEGDDELRESCLQAFEALVLRCFREITPHIREVKTPCTFILQMEMRL